MSSTPLLSVEQRAWRYWFEDGLPTLTVGIGCLLGAIFSTHNRSRGATPLSIATASAALLLYCALLLFQRQIIEWFKFRITYPRTGYTRLPYLEQEAASPVEAYPLSIRGGDANRPDEVQRAHAHRQQRLLFTCAAIAVAAVAMVLIQSPWICALAGFVMALALWIWGRKIQSPSWIVLGGFPLIGCYMAFFRPDHAIAEHRITFFLVGAGVLFALDGSFMLIRFLRANPRQKPTAP